MYEQKRLTKASLLFKMAANLETLEKAWNTGRKGRFVNRDIGRINKDVGEAFAATGGKMGPATVPKRLAKEHGLPKNIGGKMYISGDSGKHIENLGLTDTIKSVKNRGKERRGFNATMNNHELDELKEFNKGTKQTDIAKGVAHHSYAKILGRESNRAVTASDTATKLGTKAMTRLRTKTGEKSVFDAIALKNSKGETPMKYGRDRMNRSYLKAMYNKEKKMDASDLVKELERKNK